MKPAFVADATIPFITSVGVQQCKKYTIEFRKAVLESCNDVKYVGLSSKSRGSVKRSMLRHCVILK